MPVDPEFKRDEFSSPLSYSPSGGLYGPLARHAASGGKGPWRYTLCPGQFCQEAVAAQMGYTTQGCGGLCEACSLARANHLIALARADQLTPAAAASLCHNTPRWVRGIVGYSLLTDHFDAVRWRSDADADPGKRYLLLDEALMFSWSPVLDWGVNELRTRGLLA